MEIDFSYVEYLKKLVDSSRPLNSLELAKIREAERVEAVYNSNAIEGNTLTLHETKMVLEDGITISNKKLSEYLEAIDLNEAMNFLEELVARENKLTEFDLRQLHSLVLYGTNRNNAGQYRRVNVMISGSQHILPDLTIVAEKMHDFLQDYHLTYDSKHPIVGAAAFHQQLTFIHPFTDGNGRTARLCLNFLLIQNGYLPVIVKATQESRKEYIESLEIAHTENNLQPFVEFIKQCAIESLKRRLYILGVKYESIETFQSEKG